MLVASYKKKMRDMNGGHKTEKVELHLDVDDYNWIVHEKNIEGNRIGAARFPINLESAINSLTSIMLKNSISKSETLEKLLDMPKEIIKKVKSKVNKDPISKEKPRKIENLKKKKKATISLVDMKPKARAKLEEDTYSVKEMAAETNLPYHKVYNMIKDGEIEATKHGKFVRIPRSEKSKVIEIGSRPPKKRGRKKRK